MNKPMNENKVWAIFWTCVAAIIITSIICETVLLINHIIK